MANLLSEIREGMDVVGPNGHHIGRVDWVKMSDGEWDTSTVEQATAGNGGGRKETMMDSYAEAFKTDNLPEEVRERLIHGGFIRVDADGLFAPDRYVLPDQIAGVTERGVQLNVDKDNLLKRH